MSTYDEALNYWNLELQTIDELIHESVYDCREVADLVRQSAAIRRTINLEHCFYAPSYAHELH